MSDGWALRIKRRAWKQVFGETSWLLKNGNFRTKEQYGLIPRQSYLYGMLRAADCAKYFGHKSVTAIEFGVASGAGLLNMADLAELIQSETGIGIRVVGFDTGSGLPEVSGYKNHPEIWNTGDFAMEDRPSLMKALDGRAQIIWGDINQTVDGFTASVDSSCPIGFISVDVDIYSGTKAALRLMTGTPDKYIPAISMYFDDVSFFFANRWAGELAAIAEFNEENEHRKIDRDHSLPGRRPVKAESWYQTMHVCHVLDHPARQAPLKRDQLTIREHYEFMKDQSLF